MIQKVISIQQPFAYLICAEVKDIENRSWKCPEKYIGKRILIHASAKSWTWGAVVEYLSDTAYYLLSMFGYNAEWLSKLNRSAIIGSVIIADCVQNHPSVWAEKGAWNWALKDPMLFEKPILNVKGKLGFWDYELAE